jgi:hypothetical protein
MNTIELTNDKYTKADFARMKSMPGFSREELVAEMTLAFLCR